MPSESTFIATHNQSTNSADAVLFRKVSSDVEEKLINLFNNGHSPASALETIKIDIHLNFDNYESILADRKYCPADYMYMKVFKREYGPLDLRTSGQEFLTRKIAEYNETMKDTCAKIIFLKSDYIIW